MHQHRLHLRNGCLLRVLPHSHSLRWKQAQFNSWYDICVPYEVNTCTNSQQPIVTPLLLATQRYLGCVSQLPAGPFALFTSSVYGTTLISLFTVLIFSDWNLQMSLSSIVLVAALLMVYAALLPKGGAFSCLPSISFERTIRPLSTRIVTLLFFMMCISTIFSGIFRVNPIPIFLLGLLKALSWHFTAKLVCRLSCRMF
jgi:hypothetical protein